MSRRAKPFVLVLLDDEVAALMEPAGDGGHQNLHQKILDQITTGSNTVTFDDDGLGQLIRYMTQYGSGGFQGRLHRAFIRSIRELLGLG